MRGTLRLSAFGLAVAAILTAGVASAQAETCNPDGSVCLLTETSPGKPLQIPGTLLIRTATEEPSVSWTQGAFGSGGAAVNPVDPPDPDEPAPEDVVSRVTLTPQRAYDVEDAPFSVPADGAITLHVESRASYSESAYPTPISSFTVWVLAAATDMSASIQRRGRFFVASLAFTSRVAVGAGFGGGLRTMASFRCGKPKLCTGLVELPRTPQLSAATAGLLPPGRHELVSRVPVRQVKRACWFSPPCQFFMEASVFSNAFIDGEIQPFDPAVAPAEVGLFYRRFNVPFKRRRAKKRCGKPRCSKRAFRVALRAAEPPPASVGQLRTLDLDPVRQDRELQKEEWLRRHRVYSSFTRP